MDNDAMLVMRLQGITDAAARARLAFFIMLFACGAIVSTVYNNYFTWNRIIYTYNRGLTQWPTHFYDVPPVMKQDFGRDSEIVRKNPQLLLANPGLLDSIVADSQAIRRGIIARTDSFDAIATEQTVRNAADYDDITISWLGIKINASDVDVLGSFGLFIVAMYYLLCVRRLSLDTRQILRDQRPITKATLDRCRSVYLGVRQSYVMNSAIETQKPAKVQVGANEQPAVVDTKIRDSDPGVVGDPATSKLDLKVLALVFQTLTYAPVAAVACCILSDLYYVFVQKSDRYGGGWWWVSHLSLQFKIQLGIMVGAIFLAGGLILVMNVRTHAWEKMAVNAMRDFSDELERVSG